MHEADKSRILNFLIRNENVQGFESWIYSDSDLESRLGAAFYFELIQINYKDKGVVDNLRKVVLDSYISRSDFEKFKYRNVLQNAGWYENRSIELNLSEPPNTPEIQNAIQIIKEFGGLKFISSYRRDNWTLTLVEFLKAPHGITNMSKYGLDKTLVCFATAHNDHTCLFVDSDNKFYQLDNVVNQNLYEYKGSDFEHMMRQLLELDKEDNFQIVGRKKG
ncbi:MAG: hypothetical protein HEP71_07300 [Roseivirga sp.]|nr:hypothetical protein [Roseivirga sp.]